MNDFPHISEAPKTSSWLHLNFDAAQEFGMMARAFRIMVQNEFYEVHETQSSHDHPSIL